MAVDLIAMCAGIFSVPVINERIVMPVKNHISYPFILDSKLQRLRKQVADLKNKTQEMQQSVFEAERNGEQIHEKVATWLSSAEKDIVEAEKLLRGEEEAKKKCCVGLCPNLKSRYKLSKIAHKKALVIDEQLKNAQGLDPISFRPRLQPIVERGEALQSRVEILNQIVEALKDPNLNPILVYGMGGIGKTTLAKEVQAAVLKLFDDVVFVAVSETPDLSRIQREIADALGLKFKADEAPERAKELHNRLNNNNTKNILIIFDDVWQELNLYAIGILSGDDSKACKIFLTSRKRYVLCSEMRTKKEFPLGLLEEKEACRLFEKIVSMEFLDNNPEFGDLAKKVVNKCGGLPLLIQKVATDLRNNKNLYTWKNMLTQLEDVEGTEIEDKVHKVIESSYNNLKDEKAKSLFLLCPLFGNSNVRIQDLLIYCIGLGLFKNMDSIEESRDTVLTLIDKLKNESLLLDGDKAGFVKIHDVVRDIAAAIASKEHCAFVGKGGIKSTDLEREDFRRVSLPYCDIPKLPEVLQCPEAEVFLVFGEDFRLHIPDSFFEGVKKLKVLHLSRVSFESGLPSSLCFLTGLQTLSLDRCWGLKNVAMVANLKQLEVLRIVGSDVEELPREMEGLTRLKLLDLTGCNNLKVIPSGVLSNLHSLEELYVFTKYDKWDTEALVELKNLSRLTTLEIQFKDDKVLPEDWFFNGIKNYKISIGYWWSDNKETSRMLKLQLETRNSLMDRIKEFMGGIEVLYLRGEVNGIEKLLYDSSMKKMNSFQKLQCLHLKKCDSLREVIPFSSEKCLPHLEEMEVDSCDNMEALVGEGNEDRVMEFTQLTSLELRKLPNLIGICKTSGTVFFPNLTKLKIYLCDSLKYVFTTSMVKSLQQLKELYISECESMEDIILVTKCEEAVSFPNLTSLWIGKCKSLKYVFTTSMVKSLKQLKKLKIIECELIEEIILVTKCEEAVVFPELKELEIGYCDSLKNFVGKDSDRSNSNESSDECCLFNELVSFPNLSFLHINSCKSLKYVFTTSMAKSLKQLKNLEISFCDSMEDIILLTKCDEVVVFPELDSVELKFLPNLKSFFNQLVSFPNLTSLEIYECKSLKYVLTTSMVKSLKQLKKLDISWCRSMEEIILVTECEEVVEFPQLKKLQIGDCSSLKNFVGKDSDRSNINESSDEYLFNELVSFPNLISLHIYKCKSLKYVFTTSMAKSQSLKQLKKLDIKECDSMEEIILLTKCDEIVVFPELDSVELQDLPNLKRFICGYDPIGCPELRILVIKSCPEMKNFVSKDSDDEYLFNELITLPNLEIMRIKGMENLRYLWHQQFTDKDSFSKLKSLEIGYCDKLLVVFPSKVYRQFERLESLCVFHCYEVKEIYEHEGVAFEETNVLQAFVLQRVKIYSLESLKHIWSKDIDEAFRFENLQSVIVYSCPELKHVFPETIACGLLQLQELEIKGCGVEMIIAELENEGSEGASIRTFEWPKLKSLTIQDCNKLIKIPTQDSFCFIQKVIPNVEVLALDHHSLKAITESDDHEFPSEPWKLKGVTLTNLEQDSVSFLFYFLRGIYSVEKLVLKKGSLGEIFLSDDARATGDQQQQYHLTLKHLILDDVSKLKHIVKEDSRLNPISQCFQTLWVNECKDMMNIAPPPSTVSFKNLTSIRVVGCHKMTSLITASTAKSMIQLIYLKVYGCEMMKDIIVANNYDGDCTEEHDDDDDDDDDDDVITFHKLECLELDMLPNFNSFCSANYNFSFPLLEKVSIWGCCQMKKFCGGEVSTPKLQGMKHRNEPWEGNLNAIKYKNLSEEKLNDIAMHDRWFGQLYVT